MKKLEMVDPAQEIAAALRSVLGHCLIIGIEEEVIIRIYMPEKSRTYGEYFFFAAIYPDTIHLTFCNLFKVKDVVKLVDNYPGFVVDGRRVTLKAPSRCAPYGIPSGCRFNEIGRYRKTPSWINAGKPLELRCRVADQGKTCQGGKVSKTVSVGGGCDTQMRPITGVK